MTPPVSEKAVASAAVQGIEGHRKAQTGFRGPGGGPGPETRGERTIGARSAGVKTEISVGYAGAKSVQDNER